jgi:predicted nuclease of predicted toxin-antitoxin system
MRFILDENVAASVARMLSEHGFEVANIKELIPEGSVDQLVAFVAEDSHAVLVTSDGDFKKIAPRIPDGQRKRFRELSRIWLRCNEYQAAERIAKAMSFIQSEFSIAQESRDCRMILCIGQSYIRSER